MTYPRNLSMRMTAAAAVCALLNPCTPAQSWNQRALTTNPPPRGDHAAAIDPTGGLLVFGGQNNLVGSLGDTWRFDGARWHQLAPTSSPGAGPRMAMATDTSRGRTVLLGGTMQNETWEWNGSNWQQLSPPGAVPSMRTKHQMAFDPTAGVVVLFGGDDASQSLNDTWTFDGVAWTQVATALAPAGRENAAMAFDPILGEVVLFGGSARGLGMLGDTWSFNATSGVWTDQTAASVPLQLARESHAMAFDGIRGRLVITGGAPQGGGLAADQWEWDRSNWLPTTPSLMPGARRDHSMQYGPRGELIVFGGVDGGPTRGDTWTVSAAPLFGGNVPAVFDPNAPGCAPTGAVPRLTSDVAPVLGGMLALDLSNFVTAIPTAVVSVGFAPAPGSCFQLSHVQVADSMVNMNLALPVHFTFSLAIPNNPSLAGAIQYWQAVGLDSTQLPIITNQVIVQLGY